MSEVQRQKPAVLPPGDSPCQKSCFQAADPWRREAVASEPVASLAFLLAPSLQSCPVMFPGTHCRGSPLTEDGQERTHPFSCQDQQAAAVERRRVPPAPLCPCSPVGV